MSENKLYVGKYARLYIETTFITLLVLSYHQTAHLLELI